ncbi:MAG TPA: ribosome biogenesis GTP-binding protein YihA/YsxC [Bdellovibrionales bacterium]|nr:ribosome biogenesis GTP-binding protein YihA/YsxC [Bdellovibrionales bacterium]
MRFKFIKSVTKFKDCPPANLPEILIVGRSNAGKSSLINRFANEKIAYVSSAPGRTTLLNFYQTKTHRIVDSPGYGFAIGGRKEGDVAVQEYLNMRSTLKGVLVLMDIRRKWHTDEQAVVDLLAIRGIPWALVLTKADKLNRKEFERQTRELKKQSQAPQVFPVSSLKKTGINELQKFVFENWVQSEDNEPQ